MTQHIEKGTNYAYTVERMKEINFRSLRSVSVEFTKRLPVELSSELYTNIQHGVCQLQSEPELNMYIHALGLMHEAKLQYAFEHLSDDFINHQTIDIIDYGCGQAIGTICYADFLRKNGLSQQVRRVVLIEPSEIALKRAALHVSRFFPQAEIVTCLKGFDDLEEDDLCVDEEIPTLHILSNVIDLADDYFNLERFVGLINQCSIGDNHYLCIEPHFDYEEKDGRLERFIDLLDADAYYCKAFSKGTFIEGRDWTCQVAICKNNSLSFETCGTLIHTEENSIIQTVDEAHINIKNRLIELANCADKKKQYKEAFEYYKLAAEVNNAEAQYRLGCYYYNGKGTESDYSEATKWFRKAVEQGYAPAQCFLGYCFEFGVGVQQDNTTAVDLYFKASEQGFAAAQHNLGLCYENGKGVLKDETAAIKWYCKAAKQGFASAQCKLGYFYNNGIGITKDSAEAVRWYRKAADQGYVLAQYNLGGCFANGCGVEKDDVEAVKWYRRAAEQNHSSAQRSLALCYEKGEGVLPDDNEAIKWYIKAAEQGDNLAEKQLLKIQDITNEIGIKKITYGYFADYRYYTREKRTVAVIDWTIKVIRNGYINAACHLGLFYDAISDFREAAKWYKIGAERNHGGAQYNLARLYELGIGVEKNLTESIILYHKSAEQGNANAQSSLAYHYRNGDGVAKDYDEAINWFIKSAKREDMSVGEYLLKYCSGNCGVDWFVKVAERGFVEAQCKLGFMYERGDEVEQSYEKAMFWYQKAVENGSIEALVSIGSLYERIDNADFPAEEAAGWFLKAAIKNNDEAKCKLVELYALGIGVEKSITEAVKWLNKCEWEETRRGVKLYTLGRLFYHGERIEQSYEEAIKWWKLAVDANNSEAAYMLGICYEKGYGVEQSYEEAVKWWKLAADASNSDASYRLGLCYAEGAGLEQSYEKAFGLFIEVARSGFNIEAENIVGTYYEKGLGTEQSYEEAVKWYSMAAEQKNEEAMYNLGNCYRYGRGVKRSYNEAVKWYKESGTKDAQTALNEIYSKNLLRRWVKIIQFKFGILK